MLAFCRSDERLEETTSKESCFILAHSFQDTGSAGSTAFQFVRQQGHHGGRVWPRRAVLLRSVRKKQEEGTGQERHSQGHTSSGLLLPACPNPDSPSTVNSPWIGPLISQ